MKTQKLLDLERDRFALIDEARELLSQIEGEANEKRLKELERDHDKLMRKLDQNSLDMDEERLKSTAKHVSQQEREQRRPGGETSIRGEIDLGRPDWLDCRPESRGWSNQKGEQIRVLGPKDSWTTEERGDGIALGDIARAMVTGPRNEFEKRALSEGTDSAGGYTVPAPLAGGFIDALRARSVAIRAGALTVPMETQTLAMARLATDATVAWRAEAGGVSEGDPTFDRVTLTALSLAGIVKVSRELISDSSNLGMMLENTLTKAMALELDRAAIYGDGTSNSPTGVINTSGINTVSMGTNGAALSSYDELIDSVYEMQVDNAGDPTAMIMHPRTSAAIGKLKDTNNNPLTVPPMIARIPQLVTTAAPIDETQGTASNASSIVFGDFPQLLIGMREDINITFLRELYAATGQGAFLVHMRADVQLAHAASFCQLLGIIP